MIKEVNIRMSLILSGYGVMIFLIVVNAFL